MQKNSIVKFLIVVFLVSFVSCNDTQDNLDTNELNEESTLSFKAKNKESRARRNGYTLSSRRVLNWANIKSQNFNFPDGGISRFRVGNKWRFTMAGSTSYIYEGGNKWPEHAYGRISGGFGQQQYNCNPDNGGKWLNNVEQLWDQNNLVGFYHVEDHWCKTNNDTRYWASIGAVYSKDGGRTFKSLGGQRNEGYIIKSSKARPQQKTYGGAGNCHVFKGRDGYWYAIYSERDASANNYVLHIARSTNYYGAPGTWKKYYNGSFRTNALQTGGLKSPIKSNHGFMFGANPFIQWNHKIGKYVMVYHGWGGTIRCATSSNLINWDNDKEIIGGNGFYEYPTLMSPQGGNTATSWTRLYYSKKSSQGSKYRSFEVQTLDVW